MKTKTRLGCLAVTLWLGCGSDQKPAGPDLAVQDLGQADQTMSMTGVCDVVTQDCSDPTHNKCVVVLGRMGDPDQEVCVPVKGNNAEGQGCSRAAFGDDDCGAALVCTSRGGGTDDLRCRRFCYAKSDCPTGQVCTGGLSDTLTSDG